MKGKSRMHSSMHPGLIEKGGAMGTADHIANRNKTGILWARGPNAFIG